VWLQKIFFIIGEKKDKIKRNLLKRWVKQLKNNSRKERNIEFEAISEFNHLE